MKNVETNPALRLALPPYLLPRDPVVLESEAQLGAFAAELFAVERTHPIVGIAALRDTGQPVLAPAAVQEITGPRVPLYVVGEELLPRLGELLGRHLTLESDSARIWHRRLHPRSDPGAHPLVTRLIDEDPRRTLAEFARVFDLSKPHVRREISLLSDAGALAEDQFRQLEKHLARVTELLREAQRERHEEEMRADAAEARAGQTPQVRPEEPHGPA